MNTDIKYSSNLEKAISEILPSKNPLDNPDFNAIDYINGVLQDEKSLDSVELEIKKTSQMIYRVEEEIIRSVSQRSRAAEKGRRQLGQAKSSITDLFEKIRDIKQKASNTESMVNGICSDIRDLDHARRNLQSTINTIKKLQMAMAEITQLRAMVDKCQYNEVGNLLELIKEVLNQFSGWNNIDRIRELQKSFESVQRIIKTQVFDEFEHVDAKKLSKQEIQNLSDACFVIDVMGTDMRQEFIDHFCKRQLTLYELMFKEGGESSKLENTEQRYQWLVKWLKNYDENYKQVFPLQWRVSEAVAEEFCLRTNQKIYKILETTKASLNVTSLKSALKKTLIFERFLGEQLSKDLDTISSWDHTTNEENGDVNFKDQISKKFEGIISSCFEHFMYLYVEHQDAYIKARFDELIKSETWTIGEESPNKVLISATDMIGVFAKVRKRIAILNQSSAFYDIFLIFKKYLGLYSEILKEKIGNEVNSKDSDQDLLCCHIINTGEYCSKRAKEMEKIVKTEISEKFKEKVNLEDEDLKYQDVLAFSVEKLRKLFASSMEACFVDMNKIVWETFSAESGVGDASRYINEMNLIIREKLPLYRNSINSQSYFQFVCDSVFSWLMKRYEESILKCRKISESGAQQLLIDVVQLKKILEGIPSLVQDIKEKHTIELVGKETPSKSTSSDRFIKKVKREMEAIEKVLKMIWTPEDLLLETYKILIPDHTEKGLVIIMKLKGLSNQKQHKILDDYGTAKDAPIRSEISNESKSFRSGFGF